MSTNTLDRGVSFVEKQSASMSLASDMDVQAALEAWHLLRWVHVLQLLGITLAHCHC